MQAIQLQGLQAYSDASIRLLSLWPLCDPPALVKDDCCLECGQGMSVLVGNLQWVLRQSGLGGPPVQKIQNITKNWEMAKGTNPTEV